MKTIICLILSAILIPAIISAEDTGFFLRAVVKEGTEGAQALVDKEYDTDAKIFVSSVALVTPDDVESAVIEGEDRVSILIEFKPSAHAKVDEATQSMIGKRLAIVMDGEVVSTPVVASAFSTGVRATGNFTREWAESVVERMNEKRKG